MKLAFITTINSLNKVSTLGDIEFCLAPFLQRNEEYKKYFIEAVKRGRYVIVDNGIAEGDLIPVDDQVRLAIEIKASEIIIPDVIGNYLETKCAREVFLEKYYALLHSNNVKIQSVIQGNTLDQYEKCLKEVEADKRIDVIGIPFRMKYQDISLVTKENECLINRHHFVCNHIFFKPIHLLGCNLTAEMLLYDRNESIRSMDSKLVARYAFNNMKINVVDFTKPKKKLYLHDTLSDEQMKSAITDIFFLRYMKGGLK